MKPSPILAVLAFSMAACASKAPPAAPPAPSATPASPITTQSVAPPQPVAATPTESEIPAGPYSQLSVRTAGGGDRLTLVERIEDEPECLLISIPRNNFQPTDESRNAIQACASDPLSLSGAESVPEGEHSMGQLVTSLLAILNGQTPLSRPAPQPSDDSPTGSWTTLSVLPASGVAVDVPSTYSNELVRDLRQVGDLIVNQ